MFTGSIRGTLWSLLTLTALAGATGCVATPPSPPPRAMVVMTPPPPPVQEQPTPAPNPTARWLSGYWHWTGIEYAWIPGHWAVAPANSIWSAPRYFNQGGQTFYEPGRWAPPK